MHYKELYIANREMLQDIIYDLEHTETKEIKIDKLYFPLENKVFTKELPSRFIQSPEIEVQIDSYDKQGITVQYKLLPTEITMIGDIIPKQDIIFYYLTLTSEEFEQIANQVLNVISYL